MKQLQALGALAAGWCAKLRNATKVTAALVVAVQRFGPIDVLVSAASGNLPATAWYAV